LSSPSTLLQSWPTVRSQRTLLWEAHRSPVHPLHPPGRPPRRWPGCGGLAQYFNTDATLIRALFVVLALLGGPGLVLYLLMWILVPEEPLGAA
jgi:PspC domain-containing protein